MKLSTIVFLLRAANTRFGNFVGGASEFGLVIEGTLKKEMMFVIPISETATANTMDNALNQRLAEKFGVICALSTDTLQADKFGFEAYDSLHDVRDQIFRAILNIDLLDTETSIEYSGGTLLDITPSYLWYQYEFLYNSRITSDINGIAQIQEKKTDERKSLSVLDDLEKIYSNIITDRTRLPYVDELPIVDGFPNIKLPDMAIWLDKNSI